MITNLPISPMHRILLEAISKKRPTPSPSNLKEMDLEMKGLKEEEMEEDEEEVEEDEEEEKRACLPQVSKPTFTSHSLSAVKSDV